MNDVVFREMTEDEFANYLPPMVERYAQERARNFRVPSEEERKVAKKQVNDLLKDGLKTEGHFLYNIVNKKTGETVGDLWFGVEVERRRAFIYNISIREDLRGKGFGKQTLRLMETTLAERNVEKIGLYVWADNSVAQNLYRSLGYYDVGLNLQKDLHD